MLRKLPQLQLFPYHLLSLIDEGVHDAADGEHASDDGAHARHEMQERGALLGDHDLRMRSHESGEGETLPHAHAPTLIGDRSKKKKTPGSERPGPGIDSRKFSDARGAAAGG